MTVEIKKELTIGMKRFGVLSNIAMPCKDYEVNEIRTVYRKALKRHFKIAYRMPSDEELKATYEHLVGQRQKANPGEFVRTEKELEFDRLRRKSSSKKMFSSVLIGPSTVDLFMDSVGEVARRTYDLRKIIETAGKEFSLHQPKSQFCGFVIEVDGSYHTHNQGKINKDTLKLDYLKALGIAVVSIENEDLRHPLVQSLMASMDELPEVCSKTRKKLWRRIHLFTVACLGEEVDLVRLFGLNLEQIALLKNVEIEMKAAKKAASFWS